MHDNQHERTVLSTSFGRVWRILEYTLFGGTQRFIIVLQTEQLCSRLSRCMRKIFPIGRARCKDGPGEAAPLLRPRANATPVVSPPEFTEVVIPEQEVLWKGVTRWPVKVRIAHKKGHGKPRSVHAVKETPGAAMVGIYHGRLLDLALWR
jgi:hypothetical protein